MIEVELEEKIKRLQKIHYIVSKIEFFTAYQKSTKEQQKLIHEVLGEFERNTRDMRYLRLRLAIILDMDMSLHMLQEIAREFGVPRVYKLTKAELLDNLRKVK